MGSARKLKKHKSIKILDISKQPQGWQFAVAINGNTYRVELEESYWQKLTAGKKTPSLLIEASFKYLLEREHPQQILTEFNLASIKSYFADFENRIKEYL